MKNSLSRQIICRYFIPMFLASGFVACSSAENFDFIVNGVSGNGANDSGMSTLPAPELQQAPDDNNGSTASSTDPNNGSANGSTTVAGVTNSSSNSSSSGTVVVTSSGSGSTSSSSTSPSDSGSDSSNSTSSSSSGSSSTSSATSSAGSGSSSSNEGTVVASSGSNTSSGTAATGSEPSSAGSSSNTSTSSSGDSGTTPSTGSGTQVASGGGTTNTRTSTQSESNPSGEAPTTQDETSACMNNAPEGYTWSFFVTRVSLNSGVGQNTETNSNWADVNKSFPLDFREPLEDFLASDEADANFKPGNYPIARVWGFVRGVAANGSVVEAKLPAGRYDIHGNHVVAGRTVIFSAFCMSIERNGNHLQVVPRSVHLAGVVP